MIVQLSTITPYLLLLFGVIITYIGWSTKKILENIETAIKETAAKVDNHDHHISEILSIIKIHDYRIESLNSEVVELRKSGKIDKKE